MRRHARITGVDAPALVVQVDRHGHFEQVHVRFPEGFDGAHVLPVAVEGVGIQVLAGLKHRRDDVFAEVVAAVRIGLVQLQVLAHFAPGEDVNAHGSLVALGLGGLLLKLGDAVVFVRVENAEARRFLPRHFAHGDGQIRAVFDVIAQHRVVIHLIDMVAGEHQHVLRVPLSDERNVLIDGVGRALVPFAGLAGLVRRQNVNAAVGKVKIPRRAGADVGVQLQRAVLRQHAHHVDARIGAVGERKIDDAVFSAIGNCRLGDILGQDAQTAALAAREQHGNALLLPHCEHTPVILGLSCRKRIGKRRASFHAAFSACLHYTIICAKGKANSCDVSMTTPGIRTVFEHIASRRAFFVPLGRRKQRKNKSCGLTKKSPGTPRDCKTVCRAV